jgi:hypothetical protein
MKLRGALAFLLIAPIVFAALINDAEAVVCGRGTGQTDRWKYRCDTPRVPPTGYITLRGAGDRSGFVHGRVWHFNVTLLENYRNQKFYIYRYVYIARTAGGKRTGRLEFRDKNHQMLFYIGDDRTDAHMWWFSTSCTKRAGDTIKPLEVQGFGHAKDYRPEEFYQVRYVTVTPARVYEIGKKTKMG